MRVVPSGAPRVASLRKWLIPNLGLGLLLLMASAAPGQQTPPAVPPASAEDIAFFENKIRPILAESCYSCHSGNEPLVGLKLDTAAGIRKGGVKGTVLAPGEPTKSLLLRAVRRTPGVSAMPPSGALPAEKVALLEEWIKRGAPLPADRPSTTPATGGFPLTARRQHWAYQPVKRPTVPVVKNTAWVRNPVDAFVLAKLEAQGLQPAAPADKRTLLRRVTFDLTGLPPTPAETAAFLADSSPTAYEKVVERLLASPRYGERWGRHWLDLVRYGESLGHEYDYTIDNAYQYRDYIIRAFNDDVPYDQLLREHLAGDLLPNPRLNSSDGHNESIQGTGFFWLGEGKHSPVDVRQEQADRIDNQIDVIGKAFFAQTIACARCHDHKFDPIPTTDYYALYGILKSSRYVQTEINAPATLKDPIQKMDAARAAISRETLASTWHASLDKVSDTVLAAAAVKAEVQADSSTGDTIASLGTWKSTGEAFSVPGQRGDLVQTGDIAQPIWRILTRPVAHSALRSRRLEGETRSPSFTLDKDFLHLYAGGQGGRIYLVVENFYLVRNPIYGPLLQTFDDPNMGWRTVDVRMWKGRRAYLEVQDGYPPLLASEVGSGVPRGLKSLAERWIALEDARLSNDEKPPAAQPNSLRGKAPAEIRTALNTTLTRWAGRHEIPADSAALAVLNMLLQDGALDIRPLNGTLQAVAEAEAAFPAITRAPAMCDGSGENETVFVRGSHQTPGILAPRLQLAVCGTEVKAPEATGSGRLELARMVASSSHPLTARVMVNRIWKHHFGVGIVPTTDDFGHMGEIPTHPELLDWLAAEFVRTGWGIKRMHRLLVLSSTYQMSSDSALAAVEARDPKNALLHRMNARRLEAEAVRDSILAVSGRLDTTMYGPSIYPNLPIIDGRGAPPNGPLDGRGRRTLYLAVRRNFMSPFLLAFDFPTPFTTIGRRTVSNVPAQALALMNGPFVRQQAGVWAQRLLQEAPNATPQERLRLLYETAFSRPPTPEEAQISLEYLGNQADLAAYTDLCHALINLKEFVYIR